MLTKIISYTEHVIQASDQFRGLDGGASDSEGHGGIVGIPGAAVKIQQVQLYELQTGAELICWVEADRELRENWTLTLKAIPDRTWQIVRIYQAQESDRLQRGWGLDLPKSQRTER